MNRDEVLELRKILQAEFDRLKLLGDFDASAATVRLCTESLLKLTNHMLERMKK
jgi:hypothetical protein